MTKFNSTTSHKPVIDLRIPLPIIVTILLQTAGFIYWTSSWKTEISGRVDVVERWVNQNNQLLERVTRVEEKVGGLKEQSTRIETKLDTALEKRK